MTETAWAGSTSRRSGATSRSCERTVGEHPLVYLDSAATSQKPNQVIDAEADFYRLHNANAHRGIYMLGEEATEALRGRARDDRPVPRRARARDDRVHARRRPSR